jgi:hypothetical protein
MRISARRAHYWLEQHVFGFALIEIAVVVCVCVLFVVLGFEFLRHFGIK